MIGHRAAWRFVSGLTLAGFVARFFALLTLDAAHSWGGRPDQLAIAVPDNKATQMRARAEQRLHAAGVTAVIGVDHGFVAEGPSDSRQVTATVSGGPSELDRARTALTGLTPDQYPVTGIDVNWSEARFTRDFTTITRVVLVVTFTVGSPRPGSPPPPSSTAAAPTACCTWPGPHCGLGRRPQPGDADTWPTTWGV
ncbi:hypothetical protein UK15_36515 [Streptomyces variegatus]|uniref:Uncharacterized protein n=1 Tax=Streptomyces variegatus TaxID=284040 RepID=A0A0M2GFX3_9ACTN|nr:MULTISPECIES: hypothetical protein [Streptomyces]KJK34349.1 hypothetical protein UK15_36515 [Streptomyces variegatus]